MKLLPIRNIKKYSKTILTTSALIAAPLLTYPRIPNKHCLTNDAVLVVKNAVTPKGTDDALVLSCAPSPKIKIMGQEKTATIVVDLSKNILYKYSLDGVPEKAYLIASGKKNTPTDIGVRVVSHVESYPYRTAPSVTKRRKNPKAYGPNAIILLKLNSKTGTTDSTGEFIHGNNDASSIGYYKSLGCMRMDNDVIKILSKQVKRGDIVIIDKF